MNKGLISSYVHTGKDGGFSLESNGDVTQDSYGNTVFEGGNAWVGISEY